MYAGRKVWELELGIVPLRNVLWVLRQRCRPRTPSLNQVGRDIHPTHPPGALSGASPVALRPWHHACASIVHVRACGLRGVYRWLWRVAGRHAVLWVS